MRELLRSPRPWKCPSDPQERWRMKFQSRGLSQILGMMGVFLSVAVVLAIVVASGMPGQ